MENTKDKKNLKEESRAQGNYEKNNSKQGVALTPPPFQLKSSLNSDKALQKKSPSGLTEKKEKPFTTTGTGERKILTPKNPNGKTLYFFYGYTGSASDQKMRDSETAGLEDDVINAAASGFKVVYDKAGTKGEFTSALYDADSYGIYWSGHGGSGSIQTSDGVMVSPADIDSTKVSSKLVYLILAACQTGSKEKEWQSAVGSGVQFQGWVPNTRISETKDFTSSNIGDSLFSHNGTMPNMELSDHINSAKDAK